MSQASVFRLVLGGLALLVAPPAAAQSDEDSVHLRVDIVPSTPAIEGVVVRGDTALFLTHSADSSAYAFNRKHRRFTRTRGWRRDEFPHSSNAVSMPLLLADSLSLDEVWLNDEMRSAVIKDSRGRIIGLRGVRVEAEKKWRRERRLPGTPVRDTDIDDPRAPNPTDWAPINPYSYAVDDDAIWIGTSHDESLYLEYALGGILRVDRKTRRVTVVEDSAIMHSSIAQIERAGSEYLLIADGKVLRFDPRTQRATRLPVPGLSVELLVANDTAFIAGADRMTIVSLRDGSMTSRGFRLVVENDSIRYDVSDNTVEPSFDTLAILGAAGRLGIRRLNEWLKAARGIVRARALEYYYPGDRISGTEAIDEVDSTITYDYPREGPTGIIIDGIDDKRVRPFLRDALLGPTSYAHLDIARILLAEADTAATPYLRVALKNRTDSYQAQLATALALLGDTAGNRWIHAALLDTTRATGSLDTLERIHSHTFDAARSVRDPANISRLLELGSHPRYGYGATSALLAYRSPQLAERLYPRVASNDSIAVLAQFVGFLTADSVIPVSPALRDSIRSAARKLLYHGDVRWKHTGAGGLGKFAQPVDVPILIDALTLNEFTYPYAVVELVRLTGAGVDAMHKGRGTSAEQAAAQRWWRAWYAANRNGLKLESRSQSSPEVTAMMQKLYQ